MSCCIIICFALAIPIKDLNMEISNIKKVDLYEVPYGDKVILLSHKEFEKYKFPSFLSQTKSVFL